ncbi:hypothetical protein FOZ62_023420 [Perkinsus olseni]|uniref:Uncharacterized protein n=2 Tax=Perkinsus olseni TaxID=32597 RepID=A0A7J6TU41_PEROL|nr:hypothetical protein FOZ62_023420 [Perkinsus olseni]
MTTLFLVLLSALLSGACASIFQDYTLPGDEQYWKLYGTSTTAPPTTTPTTAPTTSAESALEELLGSLVIPDYRTVSTTVKPLSIEQQLQSLEVLPYRGFSTAAPNTSSPLPAVASTSTPPPGNLRGGELTSYSGAASDGLEENGRQAHVAAGDYNIVKYDYD